MQVARKQFTVDDYYQMSESGILAPDERVELIEGEVTSMSPVGPQHAACVDRLNSLLNRHFGPQKIVRVQSPVRLSSYSEPEPDVAVLRPRKDFYAGAHPAPADTLLVIEVADTSIGYDRQIKVPLYARAGIPEVWLVDMAEQNIEVYWEPSGGEYRHKKELTRGGLVSSTTIPDLAVEVGDILGLEDASE